MPIVDSNALAKLYRCTQNSPLDCQKPIETIEKIPGAKFCLECGFPTTLPVQTELRGSLGTYRILKMLRSQGMGRLYIGTQTSNSQPVAVKEYLLPKQYFNNREAHQRRTALGQVAEGNLTTPKGREFRLVSPSETIADPSSDRVYLIFSGEIATLPTLKQALRETGAFSASRVRQFLNQTLQSLHFLHSQPSSSASEAIGSGTAHGNLGLDSLVISDSGYVYVCDLASWEQLFVPAPRQVLLPEQDLIDLGSVAFALWTTQAIHSGSDAPLNPREAQHWPQDDPPVACQRTWYSYRSKKKNYIPILLSMKLKPKITIADHFAVIEDPRIDRTKRHKLIDIMTIAVCAVICGADGWVAIETYGCAKYEWLKTFLELPNGIPSHDTFARVFAQINPQQFQECFLDWMKSIQKITEGEVVAIDGKTLRGSYDKSSDQSAIQIVSAWATTNKLVLGQVKVDEKSNEITAIPELLKVLELSGCIVTIDAIGCQKEIVKLITQQNADYVITLKKNQGNLYDEVEKLFRSGISTGFQELQHSTYKTEEVGHGRHEIRHYLMLSDIQERLDPNSVWSKFKSVGMVESVRSLDGKTTVETRYFISSLEENAEQFANSVRSHWGIENSLHWILDVAFREDDCRIRKDNAPQNFALLRQIAVNLLTQEKRVKRGIKNKQFLAAMDDNYLARVLALD